MPDVPPFVLASASPRRRQLLEEAGYQFRVVPSEVEEPDPSAFASATAYAVHTAWLKANALVGKGSEWVLAADTVASCEQEILGKPVDVEDARRILKRLQGTHHQVITGVCLYLPLADLYLTCAVTTEVEMKPLSDGELDAYLASGLWEGKAGAYGIQDHDDPFVRAIIGSYSNVMGLPMERLAGLFEQAQSVIQK